MNIFDFMMAMFEHASNSFGNFISTAILLAIMGIFLVAIVDSVSKFRFFEINKGQKDDNKMLQFTQQQHDPHSPTLYDLLVQAWERHKKKKGGNKGDDNSQD